MTDLTKSQLATVLSALDGEPRNPANIDNALKAITKSADRLGLSLDDVLATAPGLLYGHLSPEDWRATLTADGAGEPPAGETSEEPHTAPAAGDEGQDHAADGEPDAASNSQPDAPEVNAKTPRPGTKQAMLIDMLRRPEGADVEEIAEATGWQKHTVRGAIAGALKKKLGLIVTSTKDEQGKRVYRIARG